MNDFYQKLNRERENSRWAEWENHRSEITKLIHLATMHLSVRTNAIILGAGNCDDLDLISLIAPFENVTLADIDLPAMMDEVSLLEMNMRNKIELISMDLTNFFTTKRVSHTAAMHPGDTGSIADSVKEGTQLLFRDRS